LEGLGIAWEEIADDINFAVKDTAYSLDQAAIVASRLSTSGIRPGETWTDYSGQIRDEDTMAMILRSISGTASATGGRADYAQIGNILTKMISYGKVNLQQLNELGTFGIGAKGIIAEYMNKIGYQGSTSWEESDISDITASRTSDLDPMLVIEALYDKFGEHAVKANETLTGVIANTKSALARICANFWEPLLENSGPLVGIMEVVRQSLNDLNGAIGPVVNAFAVDLAGVLDRIKGLFMNKEYIYDEDGNLVYEGDWINDKREGFGKDISCHGDYYLGEFKNGLMNGKGKLYDKNGNLLYDGDFIDCIGEGFGKLVNPDGFYYIGEIKNSQMNGKGKFYDKNGVLLY
jgi:hypothetical protein